jgi:hypothetical protein
MPSPSTWFRRARVRYKPLDNSIEMADHTVIPTNAHEEGREEALDKTRYSYDVAGGDLDNVTSQDKRLQGYHAGRDSSSTLGASEPDDVTEEELATLRRVSDKIPMSAW